MDGEYLLLRPTEIKGTRDEGCAKQVGRYSCHTFSSGRDFMRTFIALSFHPSANQTDAMTSVAALSERTSTGRSCRRTSGRSMRMLVGEREGGRGLEEGEGGEMVHGRKVQSGIYQRSQAYTSDG